MIYSNVGQGDALCRNSVMGSRGEGSKSIFIYCSSCPKGRFLFSL
ncbi:hypothetical protein SOVF_085860 [Spinacia oleracea]|nr:hypothetical protein SOVF_085860 [Spinacia oleracea]